MSNTTNRTVYKYKNKGHLRNILTVVLCVILSIGGSSGFMYLTSGKFAKTHGMQDAVQESVNTYLTELYYGDGNGNDSSKETGVVIRSTNSGLTEDEIAELVEQISSLVTDKVMTDLFKDGAIDENWISNLEERITEKVLEKIGDKSLTEIEKQAIVNSVVAIIESKLADESSSKSNSDELSGAAAARLEELAQRMTTAESDITTIKSQIDALKKQDTAHTSDIKKLSTNYSELKSQYDALAKTLASLQSTTTTNTSDIKNEISNIQKNIKEINETTNNLSSRIDNIDAQVIQINASISALESKYNQVIKQYKDLLEEFNTYKNYTNEQLDTLKNDLESFKVEMNNQITTINNSISDLKDYTDGKLKETDEKIEEYKNATDEEIKDLKDRASSLETRTTNLESELTQDVNAIVNIISKLYDGGEIGTGEYPSGSGDGSGSTTASGSSTLRDILDKLNDKISHNMTEDLAAIKEAVSSGIYIEADSDGNYVADQDIPQYSYVFVGNTFCMAKEKIDKGTTLGSETITESTDADGLKSTEKTTNITNNNLKITYLGDEINGVNSDVETLYKLILTNNKYLTEYTAGH